MRLWYYLILTITIIVTIIRIKDGKIQNKVADNNMQNIFSLPSNPLIQAHDGDSKEDEEIRVG